MQFFNLHFIEYIKIFKLFILKEIFKIFFFNFIKLTIIFMKNKETKVNKVLNYLLLKFDRYN